MDKLTIKQRSHVMRSVGQKNTKPEILVRKTLHALGGRFRLHVTSLQGRPDIVLKGRRLCIFVHGCFWHRHEGCKYSTIPKTNAAFWMRKFSANKRRDKRLESELTRSGWKVVTIWGCEVRDVEKLRKRLKHILSKSPLTSDRR